MFISEVTNQLKIEVCWGQTETTLHEERLKASSAAKRKTSSVVPFNDCPFIGLVVTFFVPQLRPPFY